MTANERISSPAISLKNVSKAYKHFHLKDINLELATGTVAGIIGPNGAGKSTTMRILMGLVNPDQGSVSVLGHPVSSHHAEAKKEIGYFSDDMRLYKRETIAWHMQFVRSVYPSWDEDYAQRLVQRFGLVEGQIVKGLSHGQRVKAMLLLVLARRPKLLILDEPTNGLDPVAKHEVLGELMRVVEDEDRTILYSSHNTQDVEQICDTITFIDRGRVIASQNRDVFLDTWKRVRLHVPETWVDPHVPGTRQESSFRSQRILSTNQYEDTLGQQFQDSGATVEVIEPMSLEEIFVSVVMRGREENPS